MAAWAVGRPRPPRRRATAFWTMRDWRARQCGRETAARPRAADGGGVPAGPQHSARTAVATGPITGAVGCGSTLPNDRRLRAFARGASPAQGAERSEMRRPRAVEQRQNAASRIRTSRAILVGAQVGVGHGDGGRGRIGAEVAPALGRNGGDPGHLDDRFEREAGGRAAHRGQLARVGRVGPTPLRRGAGEEGRQVPRTQRRDQRRRPAARPGVGEEGEENGDVAALGLDGVRRPPPRSAARWTSRDEVGSQTASTSGAMAGLVVRGGCEGDHRVPERSARGPDGLSLCGEPLTQASNAALLPARHMSPSPLSGPVADVLVPLPPRLAVQLSPARRFPPETGSGPRAFGEREVVGWWALPEGGGDSQDPVGDGPDGPHFAEPLAQAGGWSFVAVDARAARRGVAMALKLPDEGRPEAPPAVGVRRHGRNTQAPHAGRHARWRAAADGILARPKR